MGKTGLTYTVKISGVRETLAAFRALPKDASRDLRDGAQEVSKTLASAIRANAGAEGRQWGILARTVKAMRDRVPNVQAGGSTPRIGRRKVAPWHLLFGAEFGSFYLGQFKGFEPKGYVFFKTADRMAPYIDGVWNKIADDILARWSE